MEDARNFLKPLANTIVLYRSLNEAGKNIFYAIGKTIAGYLNPVLEAYTCEEIIRLIEAMEADDSKMLENIIEERIADEEEKDKESLKPWYIIRIKAIDHNQEWIQSHT